MFYLYFTEPGITSIGYIFIAIAAAILFVLLLIAGRNRLKVSLKLLKVHNRELYRIDF